MVEFDWKKFLSREFIVGCALIVIATAALFTDKCNFLEWAGACGGFAGIWMSTKTVKDIKIAKANGNGGTGSG